MPSTPASRPTIVRTAHELREVVSSWWREDKRTALVPTMGALHKGHLSLVKLALAQSDKVIVSIFVNPAQFAPHEDFDTYPRCEQDDIEKLNQAGAHLVFAPDREEMYGQNFSTSVDVSGITEGLCGETRPHFFSGVATIVTKLLLQSLPDVAIFGEKDFQQLHVIRRLVHDLNIPVEILSGAIIREKDGLAISSRNQYLSPNERIVASNLNRIIRDICERIAQGGAISPALKQGCEALTQAGFDKVDYLELRNSETLAPMTAFNAPAHLLAAAWVGKTRLIDNRQVRPQQNNLTDLN